MNPRVNNVKYEPPYKLQLTFNNGEVKEFDFANYLVYPVYEKLKNPAFCSKVKAYMGTVVWDEEIDFDPDTLYLESKSIATIPH
jgi:hypothetical protein